MIVSNIWKKLLLKFWWIVFFWCVGCSIKDNNTFDAADRVFVDGSSIFVSEDGDRKSSVYFRVYNLRYSPNGKWISYKKYGDKISTVYILSLKENKTYKLKNSFPEDGATSTSWLPDDNLLFTSNLNIYQIAVPLGKPKKITEGVHPIVSPNGKYVAFFKRLDRLLYELNILELSTQSIVYTFKSEEWQPQAYPESVYWGTNNQELIFDAMEKIKFALHGDAPLGRVIECLIKIDLAQKSHKILESPNKKNYQKNKSIFSKNYP